MYPSKSNLLAALLLFCNLTVSWSASTGGRQYSDINTVSSSDDKRLASSNSHPSPSMSPPTIQVELMEKSGTHTMTPTFLYLDESQRPLLASGLRLKRGLRIPKKGFNDQPESNIGFDEDKTSGGDENEETAGNDSPHDYELDDQMDFEADHPPEQERLFSFGVNGMNQFKKQPLLIQSQLLSQATPRNLPSNYLYPSHFLPLNVKAGLLSSADSTYYRRASKRSPMCLRKCMAQGFLHPAQCHSLC